MNEAGREKVNGIFVGNMMSGILSQQENLGALIPDWSGMPGIEDFQVEACGSGSATIHVGVMAVASDDMYSLLVMDVEKMTETSMAETTAADADYESDEGISFVGLNALIMQRYLYEYKWENTDFAGVFN